jgi:hypothetical protein
LCEVTEATLRFAQKQTLKIAPKASPQSHQSPPDRSPPATPQELQIMMKKLAQQHNMTLQALEQVKNLQDQNDKLIEESKKWETEKQSADQKLQEAEHKIRMLEVTNLELRGKLDSK